MQVYATMFYMGNCGGATPKRHKLWSNDKSLLDEIGNQAGYMSRSMQNSFTTKTTHKYVDKRGGKALCRYQACALKLPDTCPLQMAILLKLIFPYVSYEMGFKSVISAVVSFCGANTFFCGTISDQGPLRESLATSWLIEWLRERRQLAAMGNFGK